MPASVLVGAIVGGGTLGYHLSHKNALGAVMGAVAGFVASRVLLGPSAMVGTGSPFQAQSVRVCTRLTEMGQRLEVSL